MFHPVSRHDTTRTRGCLRALALINMSNYGSTDKKKGTRVQTHPFLPFLTICRYKRVSICLDRARTMQISTLSWRNRILVEGDPRITFIHVVSIFSFLVLFVLALTVRTVSLLPDRFGFLCIRIWKRKYDEVYMQWVWKIMARTLIFRRIFFIGYP